MCGCAPAGLATSEGLDASSPAAGPATPEPSETPEPMSEDIKALLGINEDIWEEKHMRNWMIGRLIIPDADINVAVFIHGNGADAAEIRQNVCDNEDSAILYSDGVGNIIADHNNQGFINLPNVRLGDRAYIVAGDCIITLECDLVTDGINTSQGITDTNGKWVSADEDFTFYTCGEDWVNIKIAGFKEVQEVVFDIESLPKYEGEGYQSKPEEVYDKYLDEYLQ
jgi:hypothetical protein